MIVLDTNVLSETVRESPERTVLTFLDGVSEPLAVTTITIGELLSGTQLLPHGKRRTALVAAIEDVLLRFAIVLPYDESAARIYADLTELARDAGRTLSVEDGMIAAICAAHGATLATRNTTDFDYLPILVINPWRR